MKKLLQQINSPKAIICVCFIITCLGLFERVKYRDNAPLWGDELMQLNALTSFYFPYPSISAITPEEAFKAGQYITENSYRPDDKKYLNSFQDLLSLMSRRDIAARHHPQYTEADRELVRSWWKDIGKELILKELKYLKEKKR